MKKRQMSTDTPGLLPSTRLAIALVGFLGCVMIYALRTNLSFAIVCMVNSTAYESESSEDGHSECANKKNSTSDEEIVGELLWSKGVQGSVLSAFFWGYIFSQILGGYVATWFGGRLVIGLAIFASSVLTLLSPVSANASVYLFLVLRAILGFVQGCIFPAFHAFWAGWAPPLERSLLVGINYAGNQIGNTITMPISGVLCKYGFAGGWPSIFYIFGILGIVWCVIWFAYVADNPSKHRWISKRERFYIEDSLKVEMARSEGKRPSVPWLKIFKSPAVWGVFAGQFSGDWGTYMVMTSLPLFMKDVLGLDTTSNGVLSAIPYLAYFVCINVGGFAADKIRHRGILSTINTRRIAMIIAMGGQAAFILGSGYCGCDQQAMAIAFMTIGVGLSGFSYNGFIVNYLDIAPAFAGPLFGVGQTISCIAGIVGPLIVGWLTPEGTRSQWLLVFWITAAILVIGGLIFCIFAKGEVQPWALVKEDDSEDKKSNLSVKADNYESLDQKI